jgi:diguanylate cyclase (GGDEF)-like protein
MMISLTAVCMAGLFLTVTALLALRLYADHNLKLVARAISYTTEAAVVFHDKEAALDALETITSREDIASASIVLPDGQVLASWRRDITTPWTTLEQHLARLILPGPVALPMVREHKEIARVHLVGHGQYLLRFLLQTLLATLVCLLISILGALHVARRMQRSITAPLKALTEVAYNVSRQRALKERVPAANIAELHELHELGEDFNSLLDELEAWQAHQKRENASLLHQATHDPLTGLPNRALFEARMEQAILAGNKGHEGFALLYLDCDRFKQINDNLGHSIGDEVLIAVARRVQHQLRPLDLVCRLGGDEFVILLTPIHGEDEVREVIGRVQQAMNTPVVLSDGRHLGVGISIGSARYPEQGKTADALLQWADDAMYQAKRQRREERETRKTST